VTATVLHTNASSKRRALPLTAQWQHLPAFLNRRAGKAFLFLVTRTALLKRARGHTLKQRHGSKYRRRLLGKRNVNAQQVGCGRRAVGGRGAGSLLWHARIARMPFSANQHYIVHAAALKVPAAAAPL